MIRHWSHTRQKGWGYPPKKTACQSGLRFQRYKPLKSVTTAGRRAGGPAGRRAGRPLILRFLVYISRNSLRASRSLVIIATMSHRQGPLQGCTCTYTHQGSADMSGLRLSVDVCECNRSPWNRNYKHLLIFLNFCFFADTYVFVKNTITVKFILDTL